MTVNISATFSRDEKPLNGLEAILAKLVDERLMHSEYTVSARIRLKRIATNAEDGTKTPTVKFVQIEVMTGDRELVVREAMDEEYTERTGRDPQLALDFGVDGGAEHAPGEPDADEILAERAERLAADAEAELAERQRAELDDQGEG